MSVIKEINEVIYIKENGFLIHEDQIVITQDKHEYYKKHSDKFIIDLLSLLKKYDFKIKDGFCLSGQGSKLYYDCELNGYQHVYIRFKGFLYKFNDTLCRVEHNGRWDDDVFKYFSYDSIRLYFSPYKETVIEI